jgi:methylglyoxal synthase
VRVRATAIPRSSGRTRAVITESHRPLMTRPDYLADWSIESTSGSNGQRHIALVAHDNMKAELADWSAHNRDLLARHRIYATGTTGRILQDRLERTVDLYLSGPLGGDQQIGAGIAEGLIDALIFFWDPLEPQPHDPDVKALMRIATLWNIPVASNRTTADMIVTSPLFSGPYTPIRPAFLRGSDASPAKVV